MAKMSTWVARRYRVWMLLALVVVAVALGARALSTRSDDGVALFSGDASLSTGNLSAAPPPAPDIVRSIPSAFYTFTLTVQPGLVPPPDRERAGGSLTALGDGFLLTTAAGDFYRLSWDPGTDILTSERLPFSVPFNRDAFLEALAGDAAAPDESAPPFRILDLLVDDGGSDTRLYVSHHHWDNRGRCVSLRVSSTVLPVFETSSNATVQWETVFESEPCLQLGTLWPLGNGAYSSGGRLARHTTGLLLSVGDHGSEGLDDMKAFAQMPDVSYGKIVMLDGTGAAVPFSVGHRNPQGLLVDDQGRVWSTEHGPQGGDELNRIVRGGNYGWPLATYGSKYGGDAWPLAANPRDHGGFQEPALAFVPSVGVSQLLQVSSTYLPQWAGDLLLASLQERLLLRVRTTNDEVVYTERIDLDMRVRDIAEGEDGRIVLWTDDGQVASLTLAHE